MFSPKVILHPTDFSESSAAALEIAADLATKYGARLIVLHVVETLGPENVTFGEVATHLEPVSYRQRLQDDLRRVKPAVPPTIQVDYLLGEGVGDPARGIEQAAAEQHCDLIVMGTHGHRGLSRMLLGSIAETVVRRATCPVLTIKAPANHV